MTGVNMVQTARDVKRAAKQDGAPSGNGTDFVQLLQDKQNSLKDESVRTPGDKNSQSDGNKEDPVVSEKPETKDNKMEEKPDSKPGLPADGMMAQLNVIMAQLTGETAEQTVLLPEASGGAEPSAEILTTSVSEVIAAQSVEEEIMAPVPKTAVNTEESATLKVLDREAEADPLQKPVSAERTVVKVSDTGELQREEDAVKTVKSEMFAGEERVRNKDEGRPGAVEAAVTEPQHAQTGRTGAHQVFRAGENKTTYLRTSEDTLPVDLGKTIASNLIQKDGTLTVELEPASLGKLTIRAAYDAGRLAVSIIASNPRTLELLSQRAADIAGILEEKTGQATVIQMDNTQQQSGEYDARQGGGNDPRDYQQEQGRQQQKSDSFAQQLRLGLI